MRRRRWAAMGVVVMIVAAGWLLRDFWLPLLPVWGEGLKIWAEEWGTAVQTLADILASAALIGGAVAAWLGLRGRSDGGLQSIFVTIPDAERAGNLRAEMRAKVRRMWVDGVLHKSLYQEVLIELGMDRQDDAVSQRPWQQVIHLPGEADRNLPPGTQLAVVFEETNRSLLILGEPGAGKTTELLALVEQVLDGQEPTSPAYVPVVFNLSSWAEKRQPLDKWLVGEMRRNYGVSRKVAESWVADEVLGLFLDGLDEVAEEARAGCVAAINAYREEHGSVPVCVCCRRTEYEALGAPLAVVGAVLLSPMTRPEVEGYLDGLGSQVEGLAQALAQNESLWELAETPLGLNILAITYHEKSRAEVEDSLRGENLERQLFEAYVEQMFVRPARIAWVEPVRYTREDTMRWLGWLAYQMRKHDQTVFLFGRLQPEWYSGNRWHFNLLVVLTIGLAMWLVTELLGEGFLGLPLGIFGGVVLIQYPLNELRVEYSAAIDRLGLKAGLIGGVIAGILSGMAGGLRFGLVMGLGSGLLLSLIKEPSTDNPSHPYQEIYQVIFSGLIGGLVFGVMASLTFSMSVGLPIGLITGLVSGWTGVVRFLILRVLLSWTRVMPLRYVRFLNYLAERIFLRKVGGGYIFVHRLLLDYFADQHEDMLGS